MTHFNALDNALAQLGNEGVTIKVTSDIGLGAVNRILKTLEGTKYFVVNSAVAQLGDLMFFTANGSVTHGDLLASETVIFDEIDRAPLSFLDVVSEVTTRHTVNGVSLPNLKNVILVTHENAEAGRILAEVL